VSDLIETLMSEASELAQAAGAVTLEAFRASALSVEIKADGTEVTSADRDAEHLIREEIKLRYPDHSILGEEEDDLIGDANLTWIVDPIDGTKGFVRGVPLYTTLLAVADELGPMVGVIHVPVLGSTLVAGRGMGCWLDGKRCKVSDRNNLNGALVNTSSYETFSSSALLALKASGAQMRAWGDAFGYYLVATGRSEAMIDPVCSPWDLAPMPVILEEAGGQFSNIEGGGSFQLDAPPDSISGLGTNRSIHNDLIEVMGSQ